LSGRLDFSSLSVEDLLRANGASLFSPPPACQRITGSNSQLQLPADFFNLTNTRNFGIPEAGVNNPGLAN